MRKEFAGWLVAGVVSLVLGAALVLTNARVSRLEAKIAKVDDNFVQLSRPLEETVRDISAIYGELDAMQGDVVSEQQPSVRQRPAPRAAAPRTGAAGVTPWPPLDYGYEAATDQYYDPNAADRLQRERMIRSQTGSFNAIEQDEAD